MKQGAERKNSSLIPSFNRTMQIDFRRAKISPDAGVLMLREIDERFNITAPLGDCLNDPRRASHLEHTYVDLIRQRAYPRKQQGKRILRNELSSRIWLRTNMVVP